MVHRQPVERRVVRRWTTESEVALRDCFNTTVWTELCDPHGEDINAIADTITLCHPKRCFSNNKQWITPDIKALLKEKKRAFRSGDRDDLRSVQKELRRKIREGKANYRRNMENQLKKNNTRDMWRSLKPSQASRHPSPRLKGTCSGPTT